MDQISHNTTPVLMPEPVKIRWENLRELMRIQNLTWADLSRMSGVPESTIKKLLRGETQDPRISTLYPIVAALSASIDRLVGLAPQRDLEHEAAVYDANVMDTMRARNAELESVNAQLQATVVDQAHSLGAAEANATALQRDLEFRDKIINQRNTVVRDLTTELRRVRYAYTIIIGVAVLAFVAYEFLTPGQGLTHLISTWLS